jgi:hypothetical protein
MTTAAPKELLLPSAITTLYNQLDAVLGQHDVVVVGELADRVFFRTDRPPIWVARSNVIEDILGYTANMDDAINALGKGGQPNAIPTSLFPRDATVPSASRGSLAPPQPRTKFA